jgi:hypothetical protein
MTQAGTLHLGGGGGLAINDSGVPASGRGLPQDFRLPIVVSGGGNSVSVVLGVSPEGSEGYDAGVDQLAPPVGPAGTFDVRLQNAGQQYLTDVRGSEAGEYEFTMLFTPAQEGEDREDIVLRWDAERLAGLGRFEIVDSVTGELYVLDMSTTGELVIHPGTVLYSGLRIRVTTSPPRYPLFLPVMIR